MNNYITVSGDGNTVSFHQEIGGKNRLGAFLLIILQLLIMLIGLIIAIPILLGVGIYKLLMRSIAIGKMLDERY
jgi:ABC-type phosphate transport system permease subunit